MPTPVPIRPGVVFWLLPTDDVPRPHPWIVISEIVDGEVLTVNITDQENYPESPCILEAREHPCVKFRSVVYYKLFRERNAKQMGVALGNRTGLNICTPVGPEMLKRIIAGFKASRDVRDAIKIKYGFLQAPPAKKHPF